MTPKERLIEAFRALCDGTDGGLFAVADAIGASAESLQQVYNGYKLPSGEPRGIGPMLQKRLEERFPGWAAAKVRTPWPFESIDPARFEALSERQKGRVEQALEGFIAAVEAESGKRDGTNG